MKLARSIALVVLSASGIALAQEAPVEPMQAVPLVIVPAPEPVPAPMNENYASLQTSGNVGGLDTSGSMSALGSAGNVAGLDTTGSVSALEAPPPPKAPPRTETILCNSSSCALVLPPPPEYVGTQIIIATTSTTLLTQGGIAPANVTAFNPGLANVVSPFAQTTR
jgi:hypothetical protein